VAVIVAEQFAPRLLLAARERGSGTHWSGIRKL
jgi:hypothetical protein